MKDFCPLCYGNIAVDDEGIKCKRCGSVFDVDGNVVERRNDFIAKAAAINAEVVVGCDLVSLPDGSVKQRGQVGEVFAVMTAEDSDLEYVAVETLTRNKATGEVRISCIPLSDWPEWAVAETRDKVAKMLAQDCGSRIIKAAVKNHEGVNAVICRVPLPKAAYYTINHFMPEFISKEDGVNETRKGERIELSEVEKVRIVNMQGRTIARTD